MQRQNALQTSGRGQDMAQEDTYMASDRGNASMGASYGE